MYILFQAIIHRLSYELILHHVVILDHVIAYVYKNKISKHVNT